MSDPIRANSSGPQPIPLSPPVPPLPNSPLAWKENFDFLLQQFLENSSNSQGDSYLYELESLADNPNAGLPAGQANIAQQIVALCKEYASDPHNSALLSQINNLDAQLDKYHDSDTPYLPSEDVY